MEKNELFTIRPSLKQYYGRTVTKEMEFDEYTDDKTVHQTLKDLIFTTEINKESEYNGVKSTEKSILTQELPEGTILIWNEATGYILPDRQVYKLKDLSGNNVTGIAKLDFIPSKYKEKQKTKDYAFTKVGRGITEKDSNSKKHLVGMHASTSSSSDADPIRMF